MKKIIIAALLAGTFTACNDFLDEPLKGGFNSDNIFSNESQAELAVNGIYNAATYTTNLWRFGDVASDDAVKGGNDGDMSELTFIDDFTATSENGIASEFWQSTYEIVARANNVITGVTSLNMEGTRKERFIAEAKFFRALSYFNLVNIYGKIPLKLLPQTSNAAIHVPLSEVSAIYVQIEKDLRDAAAALSPSYSSVNAGRVTNGAAYGLLAKAQLFQKKYAETLVTITQLDALKQYDLVQQYDDLFKLGSEDSVETVFAFRFLSDQNPGLGNALNQFFAPLSEGGYFLNAPTQSYVDAFTEKTIAGETDPRLDISIGRQGMSWLNGDFFQSAWSTATGYLVKKHNQPLSQVDKGVKGDGGLAYVYLRYADILLMKAEALNENHQPDLAKVEVNKVRARAGLSSIETTTESQLREIIRNERRKELGFEFHRFFDLMRWGKSVAEAALNGTGFKWVEPRFYFPIPQAELDANQALK